jgi:hypothetical protein
MHDAQCQVNARSYHLVTRSSQHIVTMYFPSDMWLSGCLVWIHCTNYYCSEILEYIPYGRCHCSVLTSALLCASKPFLCLDIALVL